MSRYKTDARNLAWEAGIYTNVPFWVMWGVLGMETNYALDVRTSSANAVGAYQFTAERKPGAKVPYPMTNRVTASILGRQAIAAGEYLYYLYRTYGTWDRALKAYNSGRPTVGYGEKEVRQKATYKGTGPVFVTEYQGLMQNAFSSHEPPPRIRKAVVQVKAPANGGNPADHSPKVRVSGRRLSLSGNRIAAHRTTIHTLRTRHLVLRMPHLSNVNYRR